MAPIRNILAPRMAEIWARGERAKRVDDREIEKVTKPLEHRECRRWQEAAIELCNLPS